MPDPKNRIQYKSKENDRGKSISIQKRQDYRRHFESYPHLMPHSTVQLFQPQKCTEDVLHQKKGVNQKMTSDLGNRNSDPGGKVKGSSMVTAVQ